MKKFFLLFTIACFSLLPGFFYSEVSLADQALTNEINQLIAATKPSANIGIIITQVATGKVLYSQRASLLFSPASVQKLFPAVAAVHYLGPNFLFPTKLLTNGTITNHVLHGNLIVKFSGDPELTDTNLIALIGKLKALDIRQIDGHVYIDNNDYGNIPYPPGWLWDDLSYGYAAPLNAIIINSNKFIVHLIIPKNGNGPMTYQPELPAGVVRFYNDAKLTDHPTKDCPMTIYSDSQNNYRLMGCINRHFEHQRRTLAVRNPFMYAQALIAQTLQANKITYTGKITSHPADASDNIVLAEHDSPPLHILLKEMLKNSDNLTTDSLVKKMGQVYFKQAGSWQNGLRAMKKILEPTGIDFKQCLINDGAGLSRYNLITPYQFAELLYFAYHNDTIRDALWVALPIAGQDGTLAWRMQPFAAGGKVRAKTGTMTGISALAGYINTKHRGILSFVIMVNGYVGKARPFKHLQDQICEYLIKN